MSFDGDAPMRSLCGVCEKFIDTEGYGIPAYAWHEGVCYHLRCCPDLCDHEKAVVTDWGSTDSDTTVFNMKCRQCGKTWKEEVLGSQLRAEALAEDSAE